MYVAHSREDGIFQPLSIHLKNTSELMASFAAPFGAEKWARLIGLYHDYGKSSPASQARIRGNAARVDHSTAGAKAIVDHAGLIGAYCVAGHHNRLPDGGSRAASTGADSTLYGRLKRSQPSREQADPLTIPTPPDRPDSVPFQQDDGTAAALFIRMLFSCLVDADRLDSARFSNYDQVESAGYDDIGELHRRLMKHLSGFGAPKRPIDVRRTEIQSACLSAAKGDQGLYSLTVPTGGGKTLSSLAFALEHAMTHRLQRVLYVIPYVNIIEQTADVFRRALGENNVVEHHANVAAPDPESGEEDYDAAHLLRQRAVENWDAPLIVTTNVQFFESLFSAKTSQVRKLHNIAGSVVIFDEAQMLPLPYLLPCVDTIAELVRTYHCTAVLMSATQPALKPYFPASLPMREIMHSPDELNRFFRRTTIRHIGDLTEEALIDRLRGYEQVLCIVNTRKRAQRVYAALGRKNTHHLSTLMHPTHRRAVLRQIREDLSEKRPCRVVATSLVEAGVDMDFPALFREEAGLDSVIQAAGRCNREDRQSAEESIVSVFRVCGENASRPPASMMQAISGLRHAMEKHADLASLDAIHSYFSFVYTLRGEGLDMKQIRRLSSETMRELSIPFREIERKFKLIDNDTYSIIIATEPDAADIIERIEAGDTRREQYRRLGAYTVSIYKNHADALYAAGALRPFGEDSFLLTQPEQYDCQTGLRLDVETGLGLYA